MCQHSLIQIVGVGDEVNQEELEMLASGYDHVYLLNNLNSLNDVRDKLTARFCRGETCLWSVGRDPVISDDSLHFSTHTAV